jgi:hypothetical protein
MKKPQRRGRLGASPVPYGGTVMGRENPSQRSDLILRFEESMDEVWPGKEEAPGRIGASIDRIGGGGSTWGIGKTRSYELTSGVEFVPSGMPDAFGEPMGPKT